MIVPDLPSDSPTASRNRPEGPEIAVMVATGVYADGYREILGIATKYCAV